MAEMIRPLTELGRRLSWAILAFLHRAGMFGGFNYLANRFTAAESGPFLRRRRNRNVQILVYHRVAREPDSFLPPMPLSTFERQMECLAKRFHVMDLGEAVDAIARASVPDNAVVITFDDGYRDNFDLAYPILSALSLPATVFLTTGVIGTADILWHDRVFHLFHETMVTALDGFGPEKHELRLEDPARKHAALERILPYLRSFEPGRRDELICQLAEKLDIEDRPSSVRLMLNWEEVQEMHHGGVSFGAHAVTHTILSRLPTDRVRAEIIESKREVERRIGVAVTTFAYPNGRAGDFDASTKDILRREGFTAAVTTIFGTNPAPGGHWDPFEIRRGGPEACEPPLFAAKMNVQKLLS